MITVYEYDENKILIGDGSKQVEEITENMTTVIPRVGAVKLTFNEELQEWYEGATKEEIDAWHEANNKPSEPNKMEVLQQQLRQQEAAIGLLATQIAKNTLLQNGGIK